MKEIAILSGKGGTGKTSLSAAFATLENNLVLADCDVDAANLYLILNPEIISTEQFLTGYKAQIDYELCVGCGLCIDYCRFDAITEKNGKVTISETHCDGCKLCSRICSAQAIKMIPNEKSQWFKSAYRNGHFVHARLSPGEENSGKLVNKVREEAKKTASEHNAKWIIIDGPPGTGCPAISSLTGVNKVLVVTEPSKSGFHDLKRLLELSSDFRVQSLVVINKYDLNEEMTKEIEEWCKSHHYLVIGKLPFDVEVVEAMMECKSITEKEPFSPLSKEIKSIWEIIK